MEGLASLPAPTRFQPEDRRCVLRWWGVPQDLAGDCSFPWGVGKRGTAAKERPKATLVQQPWSTASSPADSTFCILSLLGSVPRD